MYFYPTLTFTFISTITLAPPSPSPPPHARLHPDYHLHAHRTPRLYLHLLHLNPHAKISLSRNFKPSPLSPPSPLHLHVCIARIAHLLSPAHSRGVSNSTNLTRSRIYSRSSPQRVMIPKHDSRPEPALTNLDLCSPHLLTYSLTHSLTYLLTRSLTHPLTHSLTHPPTHLFTHLFTHSLTHSLAHSLIHSLAHARACPGGYHALQSFALLLLLSVLAFASVAMAHIPAR